MTGNTVSHVQLQSLQYSGAEGRVTVGLLLSLSLSQLIRLPLGSSRCNGNGFFSKPLCWVLLRHTLTHMLTTDAFNGVHMRGSATRSPTYFRGQQSSWLCCVLIAYQPYTHSASGDDPIFSVFYLIFFFLPEGEYGPYSFPFFFPLITVCKYIFFS